LSSTGSRDRSAGSSSFASLDDKTRDELYAMAKDAEIPGRSTMKKDELKQALRRV
jgi:hypothetical protein